MEEQEILPQRNRRPVIFAVVFEKEGVEGLCIEEFASRLDAKKFVQSLPDPTRVQKIYRVTDVILLKQKVVYSI